MTQGHTQESVVSVAPEPAGTSEKATSEVATDTRPLADRHIHSLNNAISTIKMYSGFILEELPHDHPSRDDAARVVEATRRAEAAVKQLHGVISASEHDDHTSGAFPTAIDSRR